MPASQEFITIALLLTTAGVLLVLSAALGRTVERLGLPIIFVFLALGMLAGSEGIGGVEFDDHRLAFRLGTAALVLILLDGGFNTSLHSVRQALWPAVVLATVGVGLTAALVAVFARWLGMSWHEALLLGAIVSSTDAAAVFAVLRGSGLRLSERVGSTIELESGINDPMAVILTIAATALALGERTSAAQVAIGIPMQLVIGAVVGLAIGLAARGLLLRVRLSTAGLYPVLTLGVAFLTFGAATFIGGSGLLAVFITAVLLGASPLPYRSGLSRIHDALAWLSQVVMFLMLGLLVFPSQLMQAAGSGFLVALWLTFIARPAVVLLCLLPFRYPPREVVYVGWVGLRGAVPIVLASYPVFSGVPGAERVFNVVFFVVVMSAIFPGVTLRRVTRWLGLESAAPPSPLAALEINSTRPLRGELLSFSINEALAVCNATMSQIPFPPDCAAVLVVRGEQLLAARGSTQLLPGDHVFVFCRPEDRPFVELLFGRPQQED